MRHPVGSHLQRDHHHCADSPGPARGEVPSHGRGGPVAAQPVDLWGGWNHLTFHWDQRNRHGHYEDRIGVGELHDEAESEDCNTHDDCDHRAAGNHLPPGCNRLGASVVPRQGEWATYHAEWPGDWLAHYRTAIRGRRLSALAAIGSGYRL